MFASVKSLLRLGMIIGAILAVAGVVYKIVNVVDATITRIGKVEEMVGTLTTAKAVQDETIKNLEKANAEAKEKVEQMQANLGELTATFGGSQKQLDQLIGSATVDIQRGKDGHVSQASDGALDSAYNRVNGLLRSATGGASVGVGGDGQHDARKDH